jgi:adenylate cyclase
MADPLRMGTRRRLVAALPSLVVLAAVLALQVFEPAVFQRAELAVFDVLQRQRPREYQPVPVRIVDVDDATLARVGQWPWPRTRVAELVERLTRVGAAVIAFDVVFAEPDRTSPAQMIPLWSERGGGEGLADQLAGLEDHDAVLARAFAAGRVVTGFVLMDHAGGRVPEPKAGMSWAGDDPTRFLPDLLGAVSNLPALDAAAAGSGSFSVPWPESDGVYRRVPLLFRSHDRLYPSLAAEALRVATGGQSYLVKSTNASGTRAFGEATGVTAVKIGPRIVVPTDARGRVWVHFSEPVPERYVPAWQVLEGTANPDLLAGHVVFVGTSAEGLKDLRATPVSAAMPGVQLHAEVAEQILTGHYLLRPDWAKHAERLAILLLGLLLIASLPWLGAAWCAAIGVLALAGVAAFSVWAFVEKQWLVAPVYAGFAVVGVYTTGSLASFLRTENERREVRSAFGRYVSPAVVSQLAQHPEALRLGGETREMSLLFCDVRGFTTISERLEPEALTALVNRFLTPMTGVILDHGGTIDKYMGDCIMAFWNAPLRDPDHARHACAAALAMERELAALNARLVAERAPGAAPPPELRIGIGINTGACCVGNFGSDQRFDYSVIGDEVNLASRLEGQSKTYGVTIVVGDATRQRVPGWHFLELDRLRVKGRREAERIHALLGGAEAAAAPEAVALREANDAFLAAYRKGDFDAAAGLLSRCRELGPSLEGLWALHAERLASLRGGPPPEGWDGSHDASTK